MFNLLIKREIFQYVRISTLCWENIWFCRVVHSQNTKWWKNS